MMFFSLIILALVTISNTGVYAKPPSKIVNGNRVDITEAPYTVMIYHRLRTNWTNAIICGGTIISNKHILSAAHCFDEDSTHIQHSSLVVVAGENSYHSGVKTYEIESVHIHQDYIEDLRHVHDRADIAVLELVDEISFGSTQQSIELAGKVPVSNSSGLIFGWGSTNPSVDANSHTLQGTILNVYNVKTCQKTAPKIPFAKDELCVVCYYGRTFCNGDSGGPLIVDGKVAGVLSRGVACRAEATVVNVAYYKAWIEEKIEK